LNWQADHHKYELTHWWFKSRRNILNILLGKMKIDDKKSMIELGCGNGGNLKYLFKDFNQTTGVELDTFSFQTAKLSCLFSKILKLDINDLSSIKKRYQLVAILDVLYHKSIKSPKLILNQASNLNKENGYLLISEPAFTFLSGNHSKSVGEKRRFHKKQLEDLIIKSNYNIIFSSYWGLTTFLILFLKRCIVEPLINKKKTGSSTDLIEIPIVNDLLYFIMLIENKLMNYFKYPFGSSIVILAKKISSKNLI
jgi:SAM-dependent methyltransferase